MSNCDTGGRRRLADMRTALESIEPELKQGSRSFVLLRQFERNGRMLELLLAPRLYRAARKARVWKARALLGTLRNASYGFDRDRSRSRGGSDGIYVLDRDHVPKNEMMRKIFDRFLDDPASGVEDVAAALGVRVEDLIAVRLVSHQLRLVGVLHRSEAVDRLVLVDVDASAHSSAG